MLSASGISMFICTIIIVYARQEYHYNSNCFTASVLDHVRRSGDNNFLVFIQAAKIAKQNDVDLILFPESALSYPRSGHNIKDIRKSLSLIVPSIPNNGSFCNGKNKTEMLKIIDDKNKSYLDRLGCLSKLNEIYIAAQLMDYQKCDSKMDNKCPSDGFYLFNTAVLFDRNGNLILKYHKMQPYGEMIVNPPPKDELKTVKTELGRFGFQICFDIIYEKPGHYLAKNDLADTILFPTNWFNELPYLSASQYQLAWSLGNQINLLASNLHNPLFGSVGSGIYNGFDRTFLNANFAQDSKKSRLLISRIPVSPKNSVHGQCSKTKDQIIEIGQYSDDDNEDTSNIDIQYMYNYKQMRNANVTFVQLDKDILDNFVVTNGDINCTISYQANFSNLPKDERYFLLASDRLRDDKSYQWGEEFCLISYCKIINGKCNRHITNNQMIFNWIKMDASFNNRTVVYPSAVEYQHKPISLDIWNFKSGENITLNVQHQIEFGNYQKEKQNFKLKKLSILSLYGRRYDKDPPYKQVPPDG